MNRFRSRSRFLILLFCVGIGHRSLAQQHPNVVVILADDLGYGSANCYGADTKHIRTPNETMVVNKVAGVTAIRMGDWKYIEGKAAKPLSKGQQELWSEQLVRRLHHLKRDPAEANNVIDEYPAVAKQMQSVLDRIRSEGSERAVSALEKKTFSSAEPRR